MYCPNCGHEINTSMQTCPNCGSPLKFVETSTMPVPAQSTPITVSSSPSNDPNIISTGSTVLMLFLLGIPVVGLILALIWAFDSSTPLMRKNIARAELIWILIDIVIIAVTITLTGISIFDIFNSLRDSTDSYQALQILKLLI